MKKWWMTSEAWLTIITNVVGIAVVVGAMTTDQADQLKAVVQPIVGGLMSLVATIMYAKSRTDLKTAAMMSKPSGVTAKAHADTLKQLGV